MDTALQEIINEQNEVAKGTVKEPDVTTEATPQPQDNIPENTLDNPVDTNQTGQQPVEGNIEGQPQPSPSEGTPEGQKDEFLESLNKEFGKEFKDRDEVSSILNNIGQYEEFQNNIKTFEADKKSFEEQKAVIEKEREEMKKFSRPEHIFGSQEKYHNYLIAQKFKAEDKDVDAAMAMMSEDIKDMNPLEKVALVKIFNNKDNYNDAAAAALLSVGAEIDRSMSDEEISEVYKNLTYPQKLKLNDMASDAMDTIKKVRETEVDDNDYWKTYEERQEQVKREKQEREDSLKESWKPELDNIRQGVQKYVQEVKYEDGEKESFEYSVDKETMDRIEDIVMKTVVDNDLDKSPENIEKLKNTFLERYMAENWVKFYNSSLRQLRSDMIKKHIQETENPTGFSNKANAGGKKTQDEIAADQERAFGL